MEIKVLLHYIAMLWWLWLALTILMGWWGYSVHVEKSGDSQRLPSGGTATETYKSTTTSINLGWTGRTTLVLFLLSLLLLIAGF